MPANAGIQPCVAEFWIPACAGMIRQTDAPHLDARRATIEIRGFDDLRMITSFSVNVDTFLFILIY
jgi:hypothetical protein